MSTHTESEEAMKVAEIAEFAPEKPNPMQERMPQTVAIRGILNTAK
jgi:hypothetical protein